MKRTIIAALLVTGCNIELVEPERVAVQAPRYHLDPLPWIPDHTDDADPTTVWAAAVRRNLAFLTDPALEGRRPGTDGAQLTTSAIVSLFGDAGLIPSAPTMGWTTRLGVRAVEVVDPRLMVNLPPPRPTNPDVAPLEPERIQIGEGLWIRHRGAAGTFSMPMEVVAVAPQTDLADRLAVGVVPVLGDEVIDPEIRLRGIFDAVAHRRPAGYLLQLPPERAPDLREAAKSWGDVEVQALALDAEPPQGLGIEGFVSREAFAALRRATGLPGSTVDVSFTAKERWFEDDNVVGRVAGREKPEQVVLVTANWDAGGLAAPNPRGGEAQAATGLALMLAVVERMALLRDAGRMPSRSIVFIAAAGGSLGNLGLEQLARGGLAHPENIVAVVHLEELDWTAPSLQVIGGARSTIGERVLALNSTAELLDHEAGAGHLAFDIPRVPRVTLTRRGGTSPETIDPSQPLTALANSARMSFDLIWDLADATDTPEVIVPRAKPVAELDEDEDEDEEEDLAAEPTDAPTDAPLP